MAKTRYYQAKANGWLGTKVGYVHEGEVFAFDGQDLHPKNFRELTPQEAAAHGLIAQPEGEAAPLPVMHPAPQLANVQPRSAEQQQIETLIAAQQGNVPAAPVVPAEPQAGARPGEISKDPLNPTPVDAGTAAAAGAGQIIQPPSSLNAI